MENKDKDSIALVRYSILAPLISGAVSPDSIQAFLRDASTKTYTNYDGSELKLSRSTLERWYYQYQKYGFDALRPRGRNDMGRSRKIDEELQEVIKYYIERYPRMPSTAIYDELLNSNYINLKELSVSTIRRFVKEYKTDKNIITTNEFRRYEAEHINDIWCCDTSYSFKLTVDGEKKRTYIVAIIDDASRMIVGIDVFFEDNYINFMSVLKKAVKCYGKPKILNLDNGAPYKNKQIDLLGARLGVSLHHNEPYTPTGKAKIERWFRTMKDHFMATYNLTSKTTIEQFKKDLLEYVVKYNNTKHSQLNCSPFNRYFQDQNHQIMLGDDKLDKIFLLEIERKVSIDCVIPINSVDYEVPQKYANKRVKIRYSPDLKRIFVVNPDDTLEEITILDKKANSKIKRNKPKFNIEDLEEE